MSEAYAPIIGVLCLCALFGSFLVNLQGKEIDRLRKRIEKLESKESQDE